MASPLTTARLQSYLSAVSRHQEARAFVEKLEVLLVSRGHRPPSTALFALMVIQDLYDPNSSDEANIRRITTTLEACSDELLFVTQRIRGLKSEI
jgi:hypothetical protein